MVAKGITKLCTIARIRTTGGIAMTIQEMHFAQKEPIWKQRIIECRTSGKGVKPWCREHGIDHTTYYHWEKKILSTIKLPPEAQTPRRLTLESSGSLPAVFRTPPPDIVKVEVEPEPCAPEMVQFSANGISFAVPEDISSRFLSKLLEATKHVG